MMKLILHLVVSTLAVIITDYLLPGVTVDSMTTAIVVAIVLGVLNTFVRPVLHIIALPITILTLGIFALVVNTAVIMLAAALVPGFAVASFWSALLFGVILALLSSFLHMLTK